MTSTGVLALEGGIAIPVSIPLVLEGVAVTSLGVASFGTSFSNLDDDWSDYQSSAGTNASTEADGNFDIGDLNISNSTSKHINNAHNPNKYANQLKYKPKEDVLKELEYKTFFNSKWSKSQIVQAVNVGYNKAIMNGVKDGQYSFFEVEKVTIALRNGEVQTAFGDYHYSYEELLALVD